MTQRSEKISNGLAAGALGVSQVAMAVSLAALIFSGPLRDGVGRAASGFLLGTALVALTIGVTSKMNVVVAGAQDTGAIVIAAVAATVITSPDIAVDERVPTVLILIALVTVVTGGLVWALGRYGLSSFVRFLPYPVISGFTAGTGWLLLRGGIEVMRGNTLHFSDLDDLLTWSQAKFLLPGIALALLMLIILRSRITNTMVSVAVLAGAVLFHVVGRSVSSLNTLEEQGWLVGPFVQDSGWTPIRPSDLAAANWQVLAAHTIPIVTIVAVSAVGLLLNLSGLEAGPDQQIDMNQELQSTGIANTIAGFGGGVVGYHQLGDTVLARQLGARGRSVSIIVAAMAFGAFVIGTGPIALVPRAVAGGVLAGQGMTLLLSWARNSLPRMSRGDRTISVMILVIIAVFGVLSGVGIGVVIAAAVFIIKYSRIDPVRHIIDAAGRSTVDRPPSDQQMLTRSNGQVLAFELQGYLFFGSITRLRTAIDARVEVEVESTSTTASRYVIIDFERVTGIDSTASAGLATLTAQLADGGVSTLWSGVHADIDQELRREPSSAPPAHRDLDHAIAWCEDELITAARPSETKSSNTPDELLSLSGDLATTMELRNLEADSVLIKTGATDRDLYFVESGQLTAWIETDDGRQVRIRQVLAGAALGEIAFCTGAARTATVIADTEVTVRVLTRERFDELVSSDPRIAVAIQDELLHRMGERVVSTSSMVRDLLR